MTRSEAATGAGALRKRRSWVSIALVVVLVGMTVTGVMSYALAYSAATAGIHTWFGLAFMALMALHLTNNAKSLLSYLRPGPGKRLALAYVGLAAVTVAGVLLAWPPWSSLLALGKQLRRGVGLEAGTYEILTTHIGERGQPIRIALRAGEHYQSSPQPLFLGLSFTTVPQVAFWIEDEDGRYIDTLYVTKKTTSAGFVPSEDPFGTTARPEALPYWAHRRGVRYPSGMMVPPEGSVELDAVTGATPRGHFDVHSVLSRLPRRFRVLMEINRSFDFNDFYSSDRFPEDPIYSGSGSSGQPSVVYAAEVNLDAPQPAYVLVPVGHGHHSGRDGELYRDMAGIDTALQLVERVVVDFPGAG